MFYFPKRNCWKAKHTRWLKSNKSSHLAMHFLWVSSNVVATCDQNHCFAYHRQSVRWPHNESLGKNSENKQLVNLKQTYCQYLCADTFASPAKTDDWMIPCSKAVKMDNSLRRTLVQAGGQTLHHRPPPLMCPHASSLYSPPPLSSFKYTFSQPQGNGGG